MIEYPLYYQIQFWKKQSRKSIRYPLTISPLLIFISYVSLSLNGIRDTALPMCQLKVSPQHFQIYGFIAEYSWQRYTCI